MLAALSSLFGKSVGSLSNTTAGVAEVAHSPDGGTTFTYKYEEKILTDLTPPLKQTDPSQSGKSTANLGLGQDCLEVVNKMLLEKGFVDWTAVPSDDFTLQVDLDMEQSLALAHMAPILPLLCQRVPLGLKWTTYASKSGKHTHAVFTMPDAMSLYERMAWQAVLGSDRMREALNLIGLHKGVENQVVLFMPKDQSGIIFRELRSEFPHRRIKDED